MKTIPLVLCLCLMACNSAEKKKEAEAAENAKVEARAKEMATQIAKDAEQKQQEDQKAAKMAADKAEKDTLANTPQALFESSGLQLAPTGRGHLQGISSVTLTNKSKHLVSNLRAKVDFMKDGDVEVSLPMQLTGSIPAGATKTFSTADQTLQAGAVEATGSETRVIVTAAHPEEDAAPVPSNPAPSNPAPSPTTADTK